LTANARHLKEDPNWITPGAGQRVDLVGRIRECLGGEIELDPYSSPIANTVVGASRFFTAKEDGHEQLWESPAVMVNHPGGHTVRAWQKACVEFTAGRARQIIWVGFSIEQLNLLADQKLHPLDYSVLITRNRIDFIKEATLQKGGRPSHGNYLVGMGVSHTKFTEVFQDLGYISQGVVASAYM
jgi:hypothetical protein